GAAQTHVTLLTRFVVHARELQKVLEHHAHRGGVADYQAPQLTTLRVGELGDLEQLRGSRNRTHSVAQLMSERTVERPQPLLALAQLRLHELQVLRGSGLLDQRDRL